MVETVMQIDLIFFFTTQTTVWQGGRLEESNPGRILLSEHGTFVHGLWVFVGSVGVGWGSGGHCECGWGLGRGAGWRQG